MDLEETKREIEALVVAKGFYNSRKDVPKKLFLRLSSWERRLMLGRKS